MSTIVIFSVPLSDKKATFGFYIGNFIFASPYINIGDAILILLMSFVCIVCVYI